MQPAQSNLTTDDRTLSQPVPLPQDGQQQPSDIFQVPPTALTRDAQPQSQADLPQPQSFTQPTTPPFQASNSLTSVLSDDEDDDALPPIPQPPKLAPVGSLQKEAGVFGAETVPLVELREAELSPETEGWIERIPKPENVNLEQPVIHDNEVLVAEPSTPVVEERLVLPMTQTAVQTGIKQKVTDSARWLAEWCIRLVKMMGGKAAYQPEPMHQGYEKGTDHEPL